MLRRQPRDRFESYCRIVTVVASISLSVVSLDRQFEVDDWTCVAPSSFSWGDGLVGLVVPAEFLLQGLADFASSGFHDFSLQHNRR